MLTLVTPATVEPVSLATAKAHLRLTHASDDVMVTRLVTAAREYVENFTQRALAVATYRAGFDAFPADFVLPLQPVSTITDVSYRDTNGVRQVLADYTFDAFRSTLQTLSTWPYGSNVEVQFTTAPGNVPEALKHAILLVLGDLYEHAESQSTDQLHANPAAERLMWPYRLGLGV